MNTNGEFSFDCVSRGVFFEFDKTFYRILAQAVMLDFDDGLPVERGRFAMVLVASLVLRGGESVDWPKKPVDYSRGSRGCAGRAGSRFLRIGSRFFIVWLW